MSSLADVDQDMLTAWLGGDPLHEIARSWRMQVSEVRNLLERWCGFDSARARELLGLPPIPAPSLPSPKPPAAVPAPASASTAKLAKGSGPLVEPIRLPRGYGFDSARAQPRQGELSPAEPPATAVPIEIQSELATTCSTGLICLEAEPQFCRRCGHACAHTQPCVLVVDTVDGPVCLDTIACTARKTPPAVLGLIETTGAAVLMSWPAWWCEDGCGNRYSLPFEECTCGGRLTPVTIQIVEREPNGQAHQLNGRITAGGPDHTHARKGASG